MNLDKERELFQNGYHLIGGVDEAGRGPLAGPVVAACVVIDDNFVISGPELELVRDSKKLSARQREKIFAVIKAKTAAVAIGVVDHKTIDKINILQATFLAMKKAIDQMAVTPDYILVDGGFQIPQLKLAQEAVKEGDAKIFCIAAASIIAKVSRDYLMTELDKKYPAYNFAQHKGYGTKLHLAKILEHGPSPIHRRSFSPIKEMMEK
ncbi:ribonuclease HII [Candidatus Falkowbacteria bacterium CG_4_10_14_0_2_um_filter_41_15]|uniref:Ribonuclease HII n=4 Tax=Candidatus Falkowiibacteriota TaxID=1752728 RepID=A0A2G9ZME1_9BACT|nr:MAG: ribonuclease HII [Candidatus Falkowbacteria bacterium CG1_02_41_21]PIP34322.1 MAG: ribonuclease HII [Candidatus Falkowbacteria bacterium CG23_combo_of_CG06-09_8_20_14_all_41_10]PIZ11406.1 MAG: ribonuclease HII [Candidatus Falkowbacteria bacterium CG_4_10_14_0_8_um_filter_41_36]PJA09203.1 MAG: ribonuclease HII [Candidatus Falkowbacteria bacterium CG_4_10_14_0_2_um_filter_41_15]